MARICLCVCGCVRIALVWGLVLSAGDFAWSAVERPRQDDIFERPQPGAGYVSDLAGLLTAEEEESLETFLRTVESQSGVEIAVLTISSQASFAQGRQLEWEAFARGIFDAWGIGNLPKNDGILFLVSAHDRRVRIEFGGGYGRTQDATAKRILEQSVLPRFREGQMAVGIVEGTHRLAAEYASSVGKQTWYFVLVGVAVCLAVAVAASLFRNGKRGWGWAVVGLVLILVLVLLRVLRKADRYSQVFGDDSSTGGWPAGGVGGGFGGGSSGGGGASGSW